MYQLKWGGNNHWYNMSFLLFSPIKLTSFAVLNHSIDALMDAWTPELIRDETLYSLLTLVSHILMTSIDGSSSVCLLALQSVSFCPLDI